MLSFSVVQLGLDCPEGHLSCSNSEKCYNEKFRCDGSVECEDGSDEMLCGNYTCLPGYKKCDDQAQCYQSIQRCDRNHDCNDSSDENDCANFTCPVGYFKCMVTNDQCVSESKRCDGHLGDCEDTTDEAFCEEHICPGGFMKCADMEQCFPSLNYVMAIQTVQMGAMKPRCFAVFFGVDLDTGSALLLTSAFDAKNGVTEFQTAVIVVMKTIVMTSNVYLDILNVVMAPVNQTMCFVMAKTTAAQMKTTAGVVQKDIVNVLMD